METASSWDSFRNTLVKVLGEFKPKTVMEWGPGQSTLIMQDFPSIELIDTVEHDLAWYGKWQNQLGKKVYLMIETNLKDYPYMKGRCAKYDLYFIDGREREKCLDIANNTDAIVIIHDAERESYQPYIKKFAHIFMEDGGHTAVLTNNDEYAKRLEGLFSCVV